MEHLAFEEFIYKIVIYSLIISFIYFCLQAGLKNLFQERQNFGISIPELPGKRICKYFQLKLILCKEKILKKLV